MIEDPAGIVDSQQTAARSDVLVEAAAPDMYRHNAFRVTALPVTATERDVRRRSDEMRMLERLGADAPAPSGPLPLTPAPDPDAVQEAIQRLKDPERRLVDEFFWFWTEEHEAKGADAADDALTALNEGAADRAAAEWRRQAAAGTDGAYVATHNLAVLAHALALDQEHLSPSGMAPEHVERADELWERAYSHWRFLLGEERFWNRLTARIRELDDPRLTATTGQRMRESMPLALLTVNARLAVAAAEAGRATDARRHAAVMDRSGFDTETVREALRSQVAPMLARIKAMAQSAERATDAESTKGAEQARNLLTQSAQLLTALDTVLDREHPSRVGPRDEVALRALACTIAYGNATEDWPTCVALLGEIRSVAASDVARSRIDENAKQAEINLSLHADMNVCAYCGEREPDENASVNVELYGEVTRTPTFEGTRIQWKNANFSIPRCTQCRDAVERRNYFIGAVVLAWLLAGALSLLPGALAVGEDSGDLRASLILAPLLPVTVVCAAVAVALWLSFKKRGDLPTATPRPDFRVKRDFPPVKHLLGQGWNIGSRPPEAT